MFDKTEYFINRELSWLKFNKRVLHEAEDKATPLIERLKFIAITSSNLDEFFMIRVAGLRHQLDSGVNKHDIAGLSVREQLRRISTAVHEQVEVQYRLLHGIRRELEGQSVYFNDIESLPGKARQWIEDYFMDTIYPVLTPMAVDAGHPFPFLANRSLNLAVLLAQGKSNLKTAVVQVPAVLPRIVEIPGYAKRRRFVFLEDIIRTYCAKLFHGCEIKDIVYFRITRNADLLIDEEEAEDLLAEVEKSLRQRKRGQAVRLEIMQTKNSDLCDFLTSELSIAEQDVYFISGPIDATCFFRFADLPGFEHLLHEKIQPQVPADLMGEEDLFAAINQRDILLHHPYESFEPVVDFIRKAAEDPKVLAIKQTLYRVGGNSPIVKALIQAAENGKQVTVLVELKARFDEENNILWAKRLEEAGAHVIYGLVGLKTHAKIALVVRQEDNGIKRYVHMATGNYNTSTARLYTDFGLFSANDQLGADGSGFFNVLSGYSDPPVWNKIVVAPLGLRQKIKDLIDHEIAHAAAGKPAHIIVKMNSLIDKDIIMKLYEGASQGVKIDLLVRGICGLIPGIPGVSETITVRSIVGRFLEHSRIIYVANGGESRVYLSSADWMPRNLNERVELLFPVEEPEHVQRLKNALDLMLKDNQKAHLMLADGNCRKAAKRGKPVNSQEEFYRMAKEAAKQPEISIEQRLKPLYRKDE